MTAPAVFTHNVVVSGPLTNTITLTGGTTTVAGDTLAVCISVNNSTARVLTVSDSAGNRWYPVAIQQESGSLGLFAFTATGTAVLVSGTATLTYTLSSAAASNVIGIDTGTTADLCAVGTSAGSDATTPAAMAVGISVPPTGPAVVLGFSCNGGTGESTPSWSAPVTQLAESNGSGAQYLLAGYLDVQGPGTVALGAVEGLGTGNFWVQIALAFPLNPAAVDSRYQLRTLIGQYFGGTLIQAGTGCRYNGPLQVNGLSAVYDRFPKRIPDNNYFLFTGAARSMGGLMVVQIPKLQERRLGIGGLNAGTKQVDVQVILHIYHLAQQAHTEVAEQDLEQLLDAVYRQIDADKTLGGVLIDAGESSYGIQSEMSIPVVRGEPERIEQYGSVSFEGHAFFVA